MPLGGALVLAAGLTLTAACGASGQSGGMKHSMSDKAAVGPAASGPHNAADVSFSTDMIPHHAQAVEMADMAFAKATDTEVKTLATAIKGAQAPEIAKMSGWLKGWGAPIPATGKAHVMSGPMMGMMGPEEMAALDKASGPAFDRMWVDMMIRHHQGAVVMSRAELLQGQSADAKALADKIIASQTVEISTMSQVKARLG